MGFDSTELNSALCCREFSVESAPWLSDGLFHVDGVSVVSAPLSYEQLLPRLHLQSLSSSGLLPSPLILRLPKVEAVEQYQAALNTAHARILYVWESSTTLRREQELD